LAIEDKERDTAKVIPVQVGYQDKVHPRRVYAGSLHGDERRSAAIDQKAKIFGRPVKTGLKPPPAPEGVPRPQTLNLNLTHSHILPMEIIS
jgi:hypothetical protein